MTNVKVKTVGAIFNGQPIGSTVELSKVEAEHYASIGYVEILEQAKAATKSESAPKADKPATKPTTASRKKTKDDK